MTLWTSIKASHPVLQAGMCVALILGIGGIDLLTGFEIGFSLFYVLPIALITWLRGGLWGLAASLLSASAWYWADVAAGHQLPDFVHIWNTLIRLSFFIIITVLLSSLKSSLNRERELARVDSLTGALNSRAFYELVGAEMARLERSDEPLTLVYVDLDNFKPVNDQYGHSVGDDALRRIVAFARGHLRKLDQVARLGGDEFALLLPRTPKDASERVLTKLRDGLLEEMKMRGWPITFSMGAVTCTRPMSVDDLIKRSDQAMYEVKRSGKNALYSTHC